MDHPAHWNEFFKGVSKSSYQALAHCSAEGDVCQTAMSKFDFESESTLPVKPFTTVHAELLRTQNSDFCIFPSNKWAHMNLGRSGLEQGQSTARSPDSRDHGSVPPTGCASQWWR